MDEKNKNKNKQKESITECFGFSSAFFCQYCTRKSGQAMKRFLEVYNLVKKLKVSKYFYGPIYHPLGHL